MSELRIDLQEKNLYNFLLQRTCNVDKWHSSITPVFISRFVGCIVVIFMIIKLKTNYPQAHINTSGTTM